jgi:hypothetical protein
LEVKGVRCEWRERRSDWIDCIEEQIELRLESPLWLSSPFCTKEQARERRDRQRQRSKEREGERDRKRERERERERSKESERERQRQRQRQRRGERERERERRRERSTKSGLSGFGYLLCQHTNGFFNNSNEDRKGS